MFKTINNQSHLIRFILLQAEVSFRMNPSLFYNPIQSQLGFIETQFSMRINPNNSDLGFIWIENLVSINPSSDLFVFIKIKNLVRIHSDLFLGLMRNESHWVGLIFDKLKIRESKWNALSRCVWSWIFIIIKLVFFPKQFTYLIFFRNLEIWISLIVILNWNLKWSNF